MRGSYKISPPYKGALLALSGASKRIEKNSRRSGLKHPAVLKKSPDEAYHPFFTPDTYHFTASMGSLQ
jgi:hypothetical protein